MDDRADRASQPDPPPAQRSARAPAPASGIPHRGVKAALASVSLATLLIVSPMNAIFSENIQFFRFDNWVIFQVWVVWGAVAAVGLPIAWWSLRGTSPRALGLRVWTCAVACLVVSQFHFQLHDRIGSAAPLLLLMLSALLCGLVLRVRTPPLVSFLCLLSVLTPIEIYTSLRIAQSADQELRQSDWPIELLDAHPEAPRPNIFHFIFDELSLQPVLDDRGAIDGAIAPALASLAAGATWYPNAISHYPSTFYSIASTLRSELILPAKAGTPHRSFKNAVQGRSLLRYLRQRGYGVEIYGQHIPYHELVGPLANRITTSHDLDSHVTGWEIVSAYLTRLLPGELAERAVRWLGGPPAVSQNKLPYYAAQMLETATERVPQLAKEGSYVLIHTILPHFPFMFRADGSRRVRSKPPTEADYIAQIRFTDGLLGRYLEALRDNDLYDPALIVLQADHGVRYPFAEIWPDTPEDLERVSTALIFMVPDSIDTLARVPLVVKQPGQQEGRVDRRRASLLDVYPTVAATLGDRIVGLRGLPLSGPSGHNASPQQQVLIDGPPFVSCGRDGRRLYLWDRYQVHSRSADNASWHELVPASFEQEYRPQDFSRPEPPGDFVEVPEPQPYGLLAAALCSLAALRYRAASRRE